MSRHIAYARLIIKGRAGYELRPSQSNPKVKRWQKAEQAGRASVSYDEIEDNWLDKNSWDNPLLDRLSKTAGEKAISRLLKAAHKGAFGGKFEDDYIEWGYGERCPQEDLTTHPPLTRLCPPAVDVGESMYPRDESAGDYSSPTPPLFSNGFLPYASNLPSKQAHNLYHLGWFGLF